MNTPIKLTWDEANELLDRAVEERGADYIYTKPGTNSETAKCMYFHGDEPGCIIGLILSYKGLTRAHVTGEDFDGCDLNELAVDGLHRNGILDADFPTRDLLTTVQSNQDSGNPWGEAVSKGRAFVATVDYTEGEGD